ncbi:MAG: hypothetical protein ACKVG4_16120 [Longimicrobiales bacterium]
MKYRPFRTVLPVLLVAVFLAGCGDSITEADSTPVGSYALISLNGQPLPLTIEELPGESVTLTSATLTLNADGTCSLLSTIQETTATGTATETDSSIGTWGNTGNAISFAWSDGTALAGSWSGDTIVITSEGFVYLFER